MLTHTTAVVLIPPEEVWQPIQAIRRQNDRQFRRWMPHVTLLYPFRPPEEIAATLPALEKACRTVAPFEVELSELRFFGHSGRSFTMWFAPEPATELVRLQTALLAAAPECDHTSRRGGGFRPHFSVGQADKREKLEAIMRAIKAAWQPPRFRADRVCTIVRGAPPDDVFRIEHTLALGESSL